MVGLMTRCAAKYFVFCMVIFTPNVLLADNTTNQNANSTGLVNGDSQHELIGDVKEVLENLFDGYDKRLRPDYGDAYNTRDIDYRWVDKEPIVIMDDITLPQFSILGHNNRTVHATYVVGNFTQLISDYYLGRMLSYYLIQTYFPSILIVILSWVSFYINRGATPARVALGITTVLTMATIMASSNASLPKISYVKAIDVFLLMCFLFVFASLVEYATVSYYNKPRYKENKRRRQMQKKMNDIEMNSAAVARHNSEGRNELYQVPDPPEVNVAFEQVNEFGRIYGSEDCGDCETRYCASNASIRRQNTRQADDSMNTNVTLHPDRGCRQQETTVTIAQNHGNHGKHGKLRTRLKEMKEAGLNASKIDIYSRLIFPFVFLVLNSAYWGYYLNVTDLTIEELLARDATH
uniref:Gamma-aminobutyric acid receptor subunit beta-3-like n=1 Tax=Saccoglossus kowalevskii TaxID=10224 RepID=A0ABM0GZM9_SACKO|nr:PREDICTED: gamma-aminobutyric acid receptor subunit beta-3-like [Saccoglossus kowalevskii]